MTISLRSGQPSKAWPLMALMGTCAALTLTACNPSTSTQGASAASSSEQAAPAAVKFNAVDITGADYARNLSLKDAKGQTRTLAEFKGKVVFLFFGYTQCPDVCPTTMADLAEVRRQLGADGDRLQGVFVTVDPERDKPEVMQPYLAAMDPTFIGLRGSLAETEAVAKEFKVFYQKVPSKDGGYTIDHTAGAFVFDTEGQVRLFVRYGLGAQALTADIKHLLAAAPRH